MHIRILIFISIILFTIRITGQENYTTRFEASGFLSTASYEETMKYASGYEKKFSEVKIFSMGISPQGREIKYIVISSDGIFTSEQARSTGKTVVVISAGIHAGEIEGKDASFLLMRDILVTGQKKYLLDKITLIIIPIFNVDGHERISKYNRINQNGPEEMGWRTTAQNYNLNRDWLKADSPEMQSMLKFYSAWLPDFYIDSHTTDGADYQYSVTYGVEKYPNIHSSIAIWNKYKFLPYLIKDVENQGYLISPYVGFKNEKPDSGLYEYPSSPRFSTGYAAVQNRPSLLIETHMMKPYKERVFSTKAMFNSSLQFIFENADEIIKMNVSADNNTLNELLKEKKYLPVEFKLSDKKKEFFYKGYEAVEETSYVSGTIKTVYTGKKYEKYIPHFDTADVVDSIPAASAYIIPKEWSFLVDRLKLHGVKCLELDRAENFTVRKFRLKDVRFASSSYEGRHRADFNYDIYTEEAVVPSGSFIIKSDQRTIKIIMHLLDPRSQESFIRWGFMNQVFEQKEYYEDYVMERVSIEMLEKDEKLKKEFEEKLASDEAFRNNKYSRLSFFYERSPYYDKNFRVYPIMLVD